MKSYEFFTDRSWDKSKNHHPLEIGTILNEAGRGMGCHKAKGGGMTDHASACLVEDCANLPQALVLAIIPNFEDTTNCIYLN